MDQESLLDAYPKGIFLNAFRREVSNDPVKHLDVD
jgi:hypothetical protein